MKREHIIKRLCKDIHIAAYYNITATTIGNYRKHDTIKYNRLLKGLTDSYTMYINNLDINMLEHYLKNQKDFISFLKNANLFDNLRIDSANVCDNTKSS